MFPTLTHLDDILPHIAPDTGIIHSVHDGYSVLNYVYTLDTTFDTALARECRGLKFAPDGRIIARPFHKFFNLGEKRPIEAEPWDSPHLVLDKLDGSMIHPARVGGEVIFMTRMGRSAQAQAARAHAAPGVLALCADMIDAGLTPVFEFTAPQNRIVVAYDSPALTLLAVRDVTTGTYLPQAEVTQIADRYDVPGLAARGRVTDAQAFWTKARAEDGIEGYVIAFDNGHRLKLKTDAYALRHKALEGLAHEKTLLGWIAKGALDDVLPLLSPENAAAVTRYADAVQTGLTTQEAEVTAFLATHQHLPRKEIAATLKSALPLPLHAVVFRALDGQPPRVTLMQTLARAAGSASKVEAIRPLLGMAWHARDGQT